MDYKKLKMKYHLGIWKDLADYPTSEDLIYELNTYLIRDGRPNGEFSEQIFNSFLPKDWENGKYNELIKELIANGTFQEQSKEGKGSRKWYKIINNPHY